MMRRLQLRPNSVRWRALFALPPPPPPSPGLGAYPFELLRVCRLGPLLPSIQIAIVAALYAATTLLFGRDFRSTGTMLGGTPEVWILFVPITEEILFRGFILGALELAYGPGRAILVSSLLFGLWHLKNLFWMTDAALAQQIAFTALVFGPITAWLALRLRTIWPGVMLHYLNNMPTEFLPTF